MNLPATDSGNMQVSVTTTHGLERRLEVAVPGERVAGEVDQRLKRLARTARLKGFRPGKVPYAVVRQQFGSQVHAQTVSDLMQSTFAEAVSQQRLRPAGGPRIEPIAVEPGSELRYAAIFEVLPEVTLKPLDAIAVERPAAEVTDDDVAAMIESMRAQRPVFTLVERAAQDGDRVTLDYEGRIDGAVFPGGKGQGMLVTIGAHRILTEIEQALIGMAAGATKTIPAVFPEDYRARAVAGKAAEFDLSVVKVEEHSLPPVDAEFARAFGVPDGDLERLRTEVRLSMERELAEAVRGKLREQLFSALYRDNPLDLPQSMLEEQIRELQLQTARRAGVQDPQQLPAREAFEASARRRVALGLLLGEIVRAQALKVDRERVEQRLDAAVASHADPQEARRQYLASREAMEQLESAALEDQALDWALTQVKLVDRPATFRELTGFGQTS
ncbi:MAG TPA: trigger factor [Steroidobacteraceae bacterium]|jgi:trigger factor|nr:trigger factor [Steroidobacteraceae bacterium]